MPRIHPMSVVDPAARIADDVEVGPFCVVGPRVSIGSGTRLISHVTVTGRTTIGERNVFYPGACIGCDPQDKKYAGEDTSLVIGDDNVFRENCTVALGTVQDEGVTTVGSRGLFMANVHLAHDCRIGDDVILANNVGLAGHVRVGNFAVIGGQAGVHQFVHIGDHSMVGGGTMLTQDVPAYLICNGNPPKTHGLNSIGLRRRGFSAGTVAALKHCYKEVFREGLTVQEALAKIDEIREANPGSAAEIEIFRASVAGSARGITR